MAWSEGERGSGSGAPHDDDDAEAGAAAAASARAAAAAQLHEQHLRRRWLTLACLLWLIILLFVRPPRAHACAARVGMRGHENLGGGRPLPLRAAAAGGGVCVRAPHALPRAHATRRCAARVHVRPIRVRALLVRC
jgi:hypothetical protein